MALSRPNVGLILNWGRRRDGDHRTGGVTLPFWPWATGLYADARKRLIDDRLGLALLVVTMPAALLGSIAAGHVPAVVPRW